MAGQGDVLANLVPLIGVDDVVHALGAVHHALRQCLVHLGHGDIGGIAAQGFHHGVPHGGGRATDLQGAHIGPGRHGLHRHQIPGALIIQGNQMKSLGLQLAAQVLEHLRVPQLQNLIRLLNQVRRHDGSHVRYVVRQISQVAVRHHRFSLSGLLQHVRSDAQALAGENLPLDLSAGGLLHGVPEAAIPLVLGIAGALHQVEPQLGDRSRSFALRAPGIAGGPGGTVGVARAGLIAGSTAGGQQQQREGQDQRKQSFHHSFLVSSLFIITQFFRVIIP